MPVVRVVDMRQAVRARQRARRSSRRSSRKPSRSGSSAASRSILFLNRRGYSTSLQCPLCGFVAECPNCSVSLTYHRHEQKLCCHICGHVEPVPAVCPNEKCRNPAIRYAGLGTQKVEDTLAKLFPHARIERMDSDALKRKEDYRRILGDFRIGQDRHPRRHADDRQGPAFSRTSRWSASSTPTWRCISRISAPASGPSNC